MLENIDIRKEIKDISLYKRLAYESEGFSALTSFLKEEGLINDFCDEFHFPRPLLSNYLFSSKSELNLNLYYFFNVSEISFNFSKTRRGRDFWCGKIFENENFKKIEHKIL
mgnify:FL=1